MTTYEEFRKGRRHNVDYGEIGEKILELKEHDKLWDWVDTQDFSEFEKGIVVGLVTAWIEIFAKNENIKNAIKRNKQEQNGRTQKKNYT